MLTILCILMLIGALALPHVPLLLCRIFYPAQKISHQKIILPRKIEILIPCHNEEGKIDQTLSSVHEAIRACQKLFPQVSFVLRVGLDACTDDSEARAKAGQAVVEHYNCQSKWNTINALIRSSEADWLVLVDCGVVWKKNLLRNALPLLSCPDVACVAPSYRTQRNSVIDRLHWTIESTLKRIENGCGGPISVHGATILYRTEPLQRCLQVLSGRRWLNDDVVIPLVLRALYPELKTVYATNRDADFVVTDTAPPAKKQERTARKRMALGNLQWILFLKELLLCWDKKVFLLAIRRAFRTFWCLIPLLASLTFASGVWEFLPAAAPTRMAAAAIFLFSCVSVFLRVPAFRSSLHALLIVVQRKTVAWEDISWS
ncbi:MAG: hypothetical protein RIR26_1808 [Pseudomonadota bacterium]|jgi:cellulose synthase/poly-beta-1,6-N-acetylglucosamine synthase-like glycosyltransferase